MIGNSKTLNVVELFSGIGSQAKALKNIGADFKIINTCEWNIHALMAYARIHNKEIATEKINLSKKELIKTLLNLGVSCDGKKPASLNSVRSLKEDTLRRIYAAILSTKNLVDIRSIKGEELNPSIDIMTYSFPCQDLSNVGAFHGYTKGIDRNANSRSGLLWEVERILIERKKADMSMPHFLLMENVPTLNAPRHRGNFEEWKRQLNDLGYYNVVYSLNAKDFGLPQNRQRLLMLSVLTEGEKDIEAKLDNYFRTNDLSPEQYFKNTKKEPSKLKDVLKVDYSNETYRAEALACQPNATSSRAKIWENNVQLTDEKGNIKDITTATITTKQDRHPNSGNLRVDFDNGKSKFRYLTPRECFLLMGFNEEDYENVLAGNFISRGETKFFTRDNLIKMAGNSIAVNVLEAVFQKVVEINEMLF